MRTFTIAAVATALWAGPAYAQQKTPLEIQDELKKREAADIARQYDAAPGRAKTQAPDTTPDPWRNIRPSTPPPEKRSKTQRSSSPDTR